MNIKTVITVSLSTSTARSTALVQSQKYVVSTNADCFILQGGSGVNATLTSFFLKSGNIIVINPVSDCLYIAGITASGTGTLTIGKMENE